MKNIEKLNNVDHADLRVVTERSATYGDAVMFLPVYPNEMRSLQACYPLLFYRDDETGAFHPIALLGFEEGENLFLTESGWDAAYLPLMAQRGPTLIAVDPADDGGTDMVVAIDTLHPRVSRSHGQPLFLEHGGNSPYLDRLTTVLELIHVGHQQRASFVETLTALELITPCSLRITLDDRSENELAGYYMIDDERLQSLTPAELQRLADKQFLLPAYMMLASLSQLQALVRMKNAARGVAPG
jgi:hypothetical protein